MSGDSTKEWTRYLFSGSSGWSILNPPAAFVKKTPYEDFPVEDSRIAFHALRPDPVGRCPRVRLSNHAGVVKSKSDADHTCRLVTGNVARTQHPVAHKGVPVYSYLADT
ncbi:hypothetical protein GCM10020295_57990 [Streptomyces cinereospinus]